MPKNYTKDELENGRWITIKGKHLPVYADGSIGVGQENDPEDMFKRDQFFNQAVYDKLPKKMQVKNIVSIGKERHGSDGTRYNATVKWEDGFSRSVSEYGWADFKDYLKAVLFENREEQR